MQNPNYLNYLRRKEEESNKKKEEHRSGGHLWLYLIILVLAVALAYTVYAPESSDDLSALPADTETTATSSEESASGEEGDTSADRAASEAAPTESSAPPASPAAPANTQSEPNYTQTAPMHKVFDLVAEKYQYNISKMEVRRGDTVTINLRSLDSYHDIWIDDYRIEIEGVKPGKPGSVTFVADEVGVFDFYSRIGRYREQGMEGLFVVMY